MIGLARPTHSGNLCVEYQIMRRLCSSSREGKNQNLSSENALWEKTIKQKKKKKSTFFWGPSTMAPIQELGLTFLGWSLWNQVQCCVGAALGCLSQFTLQQKLYETIWATKTVWDCKTNPLWLLPKVERKKFQAALDGCRTAATLNFSQEYLEGNGQSEGREIWSGRARFIFEYLPIPPNRQRHPSIVSPGHNSTSKVRHVLHQTPSTLPPIPGRKDPEVATGEGVGRRKGRSQPWTMFLSFSFRSLAWNGIRWEKKEVYTSLSTSWN